MMSAFHATKILDPSNAPVIDKEAKKEIKELSVKNGTPI